MSWSINDSGRVREVRDRLPQKVDGTKLYRNDAEAAHIETLTQAADALLEKAAPGSVATLAINGHAGSENSFTGYLQLSVSAAAPIPSS